MKQPHLSPPYLIPSFVRKLHHWTISAMPTVPTFFRHYKIQLQQQQRRLRQYHKDKNNRNNNSNAFTMCHILEKRTTSSISKYALSLPSSENWTSEISEGPTSTPTTVPKQAHLFMHFLIYAFMKQFLFIIHQTH